MYYIYHIPGKKIGATSNLKTRVTLMQGYKEGEYEVLHASENIDEISALEIELQKSYGYKVDRQSYKNVIKLNKSNKMKVSFTFEGAHTGSSCAFMTTVAVATVRTVPMGLAFRV